MQNEGGIVNAGTLYYWTDTDSKYGIQLFPMVSEDPDVASIEVTVFGQTQKTDAAPGQFLLLTFENANMHLDNTPSGNAYDSSGTLLYQLVEDEDTFQWFWEHVHD